MSSIENVAPQHQNMNSNTSAINKESYIKRPMNSFMLWSRIQRKEKAKEFPKLHHREISKILGAEWNSMSAEEKKPFVDEAKLLHEQLSKDYPDYKFKPRRKQRVVGLKYSFPQAIPYSLSHRAPPNALVVRTSMQKSEIGAYKAEERANPIDTSMSLHKMPFTSYLPTTYSSNPYCTENQQLTAMSGYSVQSQVSSVYQPYNLTYSDQNFYGQDTRAFMENSQIGAYEAEARANPTVASMSRYGRSFTSYPHTTYGSNPYSTENQQMTSTSALNIQSQVTSDCPKFMDSNQNLCDQDTNKSECVHSNRSRSPHSSPEPQHNGSSAVHTEAQSIHLDVPTSAASATNPLSTFTACQTDPSSSPPTMPICETAKMGYVSTLPYASQASSLPTFESPSSTSIRISANRARSEISIPNPNSSPKQSQCLQSVYGVPPDYLPFLAQKGLLASYSMYMANPAHYTYASFPTSGTQ